MRGVNVEGWLSTTPIPISDRDLANLANWRLIHTRLPFDASLLDTPTGWHMLDDAIARCLRHDLTLVLALRTPDHAALFSTPDSWRPVAALWRTLAHRYRDTNASLDLLEVPLPPADVPEEILTQLGAPRLSPAAAKRPQPPSAAQSRAWHALATRLTQEIREANDTATLIVQSVGADPQTFSHLRPTRDPHTHYSFHAFIPESLNRRGEGAYPGEIDGERWDRERLQRAIEPALTFARNYEATLYAGAFGITDLAPRQSRLTWLRSFLSMCRTHGIGWAYWTLRHPHFGLLVDGSVDYDLLGVLQSE